MEKLENTVHLVGRSGIDPVVRVFSNGVKLAKFSLATEEVVVEVNGRKRQTQWHTVVAWGKKAELIERYIRKGQFMFVDGRLVNRSFVGRDGTRRKRTEVQVDEVLLIQPKAESARAVGEQLPQGAAQGDWHHDRGRRA